MGSRTTHAKRMERLAEVGVDDAADLDRLMSPIGLDIGARTPEETAISICAEIIASRTGRVTPSAPRRRRPDSPGCAAADKSVGSARRRRRSAASGEERDLDVLPRCGEWTIGRQPRYMLTWPG